MEKDNDAFIINFLSEESIFKDTMVENSWNTFKTETEKDPIILFPISVVEEHGPHMDLSPDIYQASMFCRMVKLILKDRFIDSIIAPPYYWGINSATGTFPGSFTVREETFEMILSDIIYCLVQWGLTKVFIINVHGDSVHCSCIENSINKARKEYGIHIHSITGLSKLLNEVPHPIFKPQRTDKFKPDRHAGANETSRMKLFFPNKVNIEEVRKLAPQDNFLPLGYIGDPAKFDLENDVLDKFKKISIYYCDLIETSLRNLTTAST
jgi:creatinine amidohydrolase